jgi:hypothetical protein
MRRAALSIGLCLAALALAPVPGWAQAGPGGGLETGPVALDPGPVGTSGAAYLRALRLRQIHSDVIYFDPAAPAPDLATRAPRMPADDRAAPSEAAVDLWAGLLAAAILGAVVVLALRYGGAVSVSLRQPEAGRRATGATAAGAVAAPAVPEALADILRMADRRAAIVHLARAALAAGIAAEGALFQASWTAREALHRLPAGRPHRAALAALVHTSERVQFGGRDIDEAEFAAHVRAVRPLFADDRSTAA